MNIKQIVLLLVLVLAFVGCENEKSVLISQFESSIDEMSFTAEGVKYTGSKSSIQERMSHYKTPGLSLAVLDSYELDWEKSYGFLEAGKTKMVQSNSVFQAASVSKFVTAVIVMHYVEKGVLDLDTDINRYLKTWKMPQNEYNANVDITLRHLLTHQSGLPATNFINEGGKYPSIQSVLKGKKPAINKPAIPEYIPGSKWLYSNIGYVVVQLVLEDCLGKSLDEIAREVIFRPLGMYSSTFNYPVKKLLKSREAKPHSTDGKVQPVDQNYPGRAQGGLLTTTKDMSLLLAELMKTYKGESEKVIRKETLKAMLEKQADVPVQTFGFTIGMGIGVFVEGEGDNVAFMHPGHSYPGSVFLVFALPGLGQGMALGCNGNIGDRLELEVLSTLVDLYKWPSGKFFE